MAMSSTDRLVGKLHHSMSSARISAVVKPMMEAANQQIHDGTATIDDVLMALAYMLGASMKHRGILLDADAPLRTALPPLVDGYEDQAQQDRKHAS